MSTSENLAVLALAVALGTTLWRLVQWLEATWRIRVLISLANPADAAHYSRSVGEQWRGPMTVIRSDDPICGVTGLRRVRLLISTATLERLTPEELSIVIAHECAHVVRRDPLRRLLAHLVRAAHFPGLGRQALASWSLAAEMVCDQAAARHCGSEVSVAETLVRFRRTRRPPTARSRLLAWARASGASFLDTFSRSRRKKASARLV